MTRLLAFLVPIVLVGCELPEPGSDKDGTGDTATTDTTDGGGHGGHGSGEKGWTLVPLIDDGDIFHTDNDLVTGISFSTVDKGVVVTTGSNSTFAEGGAIFAASHHAIEKVLFSGYESTDCLLGTTDFVGITATEDGFVAQAQACNLIASTDGGDSFDIGPVGAGDPFGIERILAFRSVGKKTVLVRDTGVVSTSNDKPGPNAIWDDIWAPGALPPIPDPVPADQCQAFEGSNSVPPLSQAAFVSEDGQFLAYVNVEYYRPPGVCISDDGGHSFYPHDLDGVDDDVAWATPNGVLFSSPTNGITWYANNIYPEANYVYHSDNGGKAWKKADLPASVAKAEIELRSAFFAPGTDTGWLVGFDYDHSLPLLLKTTDGGATWKSSGGDLAQKVYDAGGGKLWTGFALDEDHIWVGGERGILAANDAGGE